MRPAYNLLTKRAALFGLDARIALAIFSGLTIVTGATIFNAISQSRTAAEVAEMNNIAKAFGDYVLDVGAAPSKIEDLITMTGTGWNGPYVTYVDSHPANNNYLVHTINGRPVALSLEYAADQQNSAPNLVLSPCTSSNCWGWLSFHDTGMPYTQMLKIDRAMDGAVHGERGRLRLESTTPTVSHNGTAVKLRLGSVRTPGN